MNLNKINMFKVFVSFTVASILLATGCQKADSVEVSKYDVENPFDNIQGSNEETGENDFVLPEIDLSNWKVTLPIKVDGKLVEVEPPEILDYAKNEVLKPFMYNDSVNGALVFYTYPESTTTNSRYSRTELREQIVPGSNSSNWTFSQGGTMRGTLSLDEISKDTSGKFHRTMIMQIHGRLTDEQRDLIGEDDNNAPPILKIYWQDGYVRVITKKLKDLSISEVDILKTDSWTDGESHVFSRKVDNDKFTLEISARSGEIEVSMDDTEVKLFANSDLEKWNVFENYFKAGNYLGTTDPDGFARVKFYDLEVSH